MQRCFLAAIQIARIIQRVELVACICCEKQDSEESPFDLIGVYNIDGPNKGVYDTSERAHLLGSIQSGAVIQRHDRLEFPNPVPTAERLQTHLCLFSLLLHLCPPVMVCR